MEKWKTFPCKDCIIKKICTEWCFKWPRKYSDLVDYIEENDLECTCLSCGASGVSWRIVEACQECNIHGMNKEI